VGQKSTAYDIVKVYIDNKLGTFTKQDVLKNCPSIGKASVEAALKRLVEEHYIEKIGAGRSTCYARK